MFDPKIGMFGPKIAMLGPRIGTFGGKTETFDPNARANMVPPTTGNLWMAAAGSQRF
jgi:hypothetical protein